MLTLNTPIDQITGVGPKMVQRLGKLGIGTISDLIFHFPIRYDDFSNTVPIVNLKINQSCCIKGKILQIRNQRSPKGRMFLTHALISDETGSIKAIWFNQPFLTRTFKNGTAVVLSGKIEYGPEGIYLKSPSYDKEVGIFPIYPETEGLNSKYLRKIIKPLLFLASRFEEFLPKEIKQSEKLIDLGEALRQIHFPDSFKMVQKSKERLAFDELFLLQLKMLKMKQDWQKNKAPQIKFDQKLVQNLVAKLPFKLTNAQRKAAWEILLDLQRDIPMNRLLQGDVGSGKTVVAAIAMLVAAKNNFQSVIMAPTEILAIQHFNNLKDLFADFKVKVGLLTHGKNEINHTKVKKADLIKQIKVGKVDIIIGTHALLQEKVDFKNLALAIIDEQHRFGIKQRGILREKSFITPHLLSMSATPIPRSLSLALYGDLDLSILDEMPPGRQKISTYLIPPQKRASAYGFVKKEIEKGRQIFVICPLIEESDKLGVKAATKEYEKLKREVFVDFKIGLLHGRMKTREKEKIMNNFTKGEFDILVSTAVVEVGVDVPNATVMMIEGAERFGLAQLHQFRGRVGRGGHKSFCLLFTDSSLGKTSRRLSALVKLQDGFQLAEKDLEIRGPGELYGIRQHGFWDLKMASLTDAVMIQKAQKEAQKVIESGLDNYPTLAKKMEDFEKERRLE